MATAAPAFSDLFRARWYPLAVPRIQLDDHDARIVYLATVYHLGRPGSEVDASTLEHHDRGLGPLREALEPAIGQPGIEVELSDYQLHRLGEALLGVVNELKQYEMSMGRSAVPSFSETVQRLFRDVTPEEPGAALDLVSQAMMLRRRLDTAVRASDAALQSAAGEPRETEAGT